MAIVIRPYQEYDPHDYDTEEIYADILKNIGLVDVSVTTYNYRKYCSFKFPDGTQITDVLMSLHVGCAMLYDLEAHIIIFIREAFRAKRVSPSAELLDVLSLCVLPTHSGGVVDALYHGDKFPAICNIFNIMEKPDYADGFNPSSCVLLPAYAGVPAGLVELSNCYVALNATYIIGTKLVDETGTKWISLIGPLLYKVPTIE